MLRPSKLLLLLALLAPFGCDDSSVEDAGTSDAGRADARPDATPDARPDAAPDASVRDLGGLDAEPRDAAPDASSPDASEDAATPDALADASDVDADVADAEEADAEEADAEEVDAGPQVCPTNCSATAPSETIPTTGLVLWLRSDRGVNVGPNEEVCLWCDLSGSGHDMPAVGVPHRLPAATGGLPAVECGAGNFVARGDLVNIPSTAGRTFIAVFRLRTTSARTQPIGQGQSGSAGTFVMIDSNTFNTPAQRYGVYVTNNAYSTSVATSTNAEVHTMRLGSMQVGVPVLSQLQYFVGGLEQTIARTPGGLGNTNIEAFTAANYTAVGTSASLHEISEVLVYDRPLTDPERVEVETYLIARYGL